MKPLTWTFVDHRLVPRDVRWPVVTPGEGGVDHGGERGKRRAVPVVGNEVGARCSFLVPEHLVAPAVRAADLLGIRVEQELRRVEALAGLRVVATVDAIAIQLTRSYLGEVAVPDHVGVFGQRHAAGFVCRLG